MLTLRSVELTQTMTKTTLSLNRLREALDYDPATGIFRWRVCVSRKTQIGGVAGSVYPNGYLRVKLDGRDYLAHRLAWFHVTGKWPTGQIDHRDLDRTNNRFDNLREATGSQNQANRKMLEKAASGYKGVCRYNHRKLKRPYHAKFQHKGKVHSVGYFATAEEAHAAYAEAVKVFNGEFART